jgi:hypothetical protein
MELSEDFYVNEHDFVKEMLAEVVKKYFKIIFLLF